MAEATALTERAVDPVRETTLSTLGVEVLVAEPAEVTALVVTGFWLETDVTGVELIGVVETCGAPETFV